MLLLTSICLLCWTGDAVTTAGDQNNAKYIVQPTQYKYFVSLMQRGDCAGAIIGGRYVVTAAHCLCGSSLAQVKTILSDGSAVYPVKAFHNPACKFSCEEDGPNTCDAAVLEYSTNFSSAGAPISVYRWADEVGKTVKILGYGNTGNADTGTCTASGDGKMRRVENVVTAVEGSPGGVLKYVMDQSGLDLEGMAQNGDSGGPAVITRDGVEYLAGVNSGTDEANPCDYTSVDQYARLSPHYSFISSVLGGTTFASNSARSTSGLLSFAFIATTYALTV